MKLLNVSFGIYAFLPQGWVFMAFVILLECLLLTHLLSKKWYDKKIWLNISITNIISGIVGIAISMILNGGWWLVVWFPWVSNNEINISNKEALYGLSIYYGLAFIFTLIIEAFCNLSLFKTIYSKSDILKATIWTNILSYTIGSGILYLYSFR